MALQPVNVLGNEFSPQSQSGASGQTVEFRNQRASQVTVTLNIAPGPSNFFSSNQLILKPKGQMGDAKTVSFQGNPSSKGYFEAPEEEKMGVGAGGVIVGDITVNPDK